MTLKNQIPKIDNYYMPAEFDKHQGCILIWPERPGSWIYEAKDARRAFEDVIRAISKSEKVFLATSEKGLESAQEMAKRVCAENGEGSVNVFLQKTDDSWARDIAPTFIKSRENGKKVRAINWEFNAWGGEFDGLYADYENDNAFAGAVADMLGVDVYDVSPFVLEGGSIHSDGEGTIMVTESCLLSGGRNPKMSKREIEKMLCDYLGAEKVLWLPRGIYNDETNEHVDNVCAFIKPGEVVLAWTDNVNDPQYELSKSSLEYLENVRDAKGRKIKINKLYIPDAPVCITQEELDGYTFEEGEDEREVGERLAASYVNFYFSNDGIVLPQFGTGYEESDKRAVETMKKLCPDRKIYPIAARAILVGGGNIHCITQQIPE